jgi:hypothetical protein
VREWLKGLDEAERQGVGKDLLRAQWRWPIDMPMCRPMGDGLWEIRTDLPTKRTARVLLCLYRSPHRSKGRCLRGFVWAFGVPVSIRSPHRSKGRWMVRFGPDS